MGMLRIDKVMCAAVAALTLLTFLTSVWGVGLLNNMPQFILGTGNMPMSAHTTLQNTFDVWQAEPPKANLSATPDTLINFMHIPKTGGTTFNQYLRHKLGPLTRKGYCPNSDCCNKTEDLDYDISTLLGATGGVSPCSIYHKEAGYESQLKLQASTTQPVLGVVLFRNPITSVLSALGHDLAYGRYADVSSKIQATLDGKCNGPNMHKTSTVLQENAQNAGWHEACVGYRLKNRQAYHLFGDFDEIVRSTDIAHNILDSLFFVGITEYMQASQCLLEYQLGLFDCNSCGFECPMNAETHAMNNGSIDPASDSAGSRATPRANIHSNPAKASFSLTYEELKTIESWAHVDTQLYAHATNLFFQRVRYVEKEMGVKLICDEQMNGSAGDG